MPQYQKGLDRFLRNEITPYQLGYEACQQGLRLSANPFIVRVDYDEWEEGWYKYLDMFG